MGLQREILQNVAGDFANPIRVQQCLLIFRRREFLLILLGFDGLELGAHIVVVHFELQNLLIADRIGDDIGV